MLTAERLRELLDYDPDTGAFTWRVTRSHQIKAGNVAGSTIAKDYVQIRIDGRRYLAHRLAWFYIYGEWPAGQLDHADTHGNHNWITNLRPATQTQNNGNMRRRSDNTSGFKGVSWCTARQCWRTMITVAGRRSHTPSSWSPKASRSTDPATG